MDSIADRPPMQRHALPHPRAGVVPEDTMKKTDTLLQSDIIDELRFDPSVGVSEIGVAAKDGVITLTGKVETFAMKFAAARAAERVAGVRAVANELTVALLSSFTKTDTDIAHAVASALKWDVEIPDEELKARVEKGWVWLEGEVEWRFQISAAERAIRNLSGVVGVTNLIALKPRASSGDVQARIENAIKRHAELDSRQITVSAVGGRVTLRGKVRSWAERGDAESAAWSAPGVTAVTDELLVTF
jgi:osmotically-inducible protein OsmY